MVCNSEGNFAEGKFRKFFKKDNLIIMVLVGILLFIVALPVKSGKNTDAGKNATDSLLQGGTASAEQQEQAAQKWENVLTYSEGYARDMEKRLEDTLSNVKGVGKVKVMVTLSTTEEVVVEKDEDTHESRTKEEDVNGGKREILQTQGSQETVEKGTGEPYIRKTILPQIEGVIVVAEGGGGGSLDKKITEMVQAVTGVDAHKVIVAKMK